MSENKARVDFDDETGIPADEYENLAKKFIPGYDGFYALAEIMLAEDLPEAAAKSLQLSAKRFRRRNLRELILRKKCSK